MAFAIEAVTVEARGLSFPALSCGSGPLVLCMHGFPDTRHSFRHQLHAFAEAGYRALAPALRGYAPSALPPLRDCNVLEVARDAVALVAAMGERSAHLVGHDWGAAAAYLAASASPGTWRSVTTLAVPHPLALLAQLPRVPLQLRRSWYMVFFQLPRIPERAIRARDFALIEQLWRAWSPGYATPNPELAEVRRAFADPSVVAAALAYYRSAFAQRAPAQQQALALLRRQVDVPVLALTGADDGCVDTRMFDLAAQQRWLSNVVVERMQGVGHFLHVEDPQRVSGRILAWLSRHEPRA